MVGGALVWCRRAFLIVLLCQREEWSEAQTAAIPIRGQELRILCQELINEQSPCLRLYRTSLATLTLDK
jgi:hypothetical protein